MMTIFGCTLFGGTEAEAPARAKMTRRNSKSGKIAVK
jgi:hypothetical protein